MTTNLASGPVNLVSEIVFIRLYLTSKNAVTLSHARGEYRGEVYRPADDVESTLYVYKSWLMDKYPRELMLKEIPGLYPIPTLGPIFIEFLTWNYRATRWGEVDRESWAKLVAKAAGGLSLVDSKIVLSEEEVAWVNKYDVWSGSVERLEDDVPVRSALCEGTTCDGRSVEEVGQVKTLGGVVDKRGLTMALRLTSGFSLIECRCALEICDWSVSDADKWLRGRR